MIAIKKALRAVFVRMHAQKAIRWGSFGLAGGAASALLLGVASFLWPLEHVLFYGIGFFLGCGALGLFLGLLWPISVKQAARHADACGLMARAQTALELQSMPQTPMSDLQREDALGALQRMNTRVSMLLRPHRSSLWVSLVCAGVFVGLLLLPNPQNEILQAKVGFRQEMQKQAKLLEEGAAKIDPEEDRAAQEARRLLGDLARELRTADEPRQALQAIDKAEREMTELRKKETASLRNALSQSGLNALANAMEQQEEANMREALKNEDKEALAAALSEAARNMGNSPGAEALKDAADAVSTGNLQKAQAALNAAATANAGSTSQGSTSMRMAQMGTASASQSLGAGTQGNAAALAALGAIGQRGITSGQGAGSGQSAGSGQGTGIGAGQGTTNQDAGYTNNASTSSQGGTRPAKEKLAQYEAIYDPTRLGGEGEIAQERGMIGEGEISEFTMDGGVGSITESVPYPEVAYEYQQAAVQSVESADLPAYVQKWVTNYFQSLLE